MRGFAPAFLAHPRLDGICNADLVLLVTGNYTELVDACLATPLPDAYSVYSDTSFLGQEQRVQVGSVSYSYHRFGPLAGQSVSGKITLIVVRFRICSLQYNSLTSKYADMSLTTLG